MTKTFRRTLLAALTCGVLSGAIGPAQGLLLDAGPPGFDNPAETRTVSCASIPASIRVLEHELCK